VVPARAAEELHDLRQVAAVVTLELRRIREVGGAKLHAEVRQERGDQRGAIVAIGE